MSQTINNVCVKRAAKKSITLRIDYAGLAEMLAASFPDRFTQRSQRGRRRYVGISLSRFRCGGIGQWTPSSKVNP